MSPLNTLVVGVDGSDASAAALSWAAAHIPDEGTLHAVHGFSPKAELALALLQRDWIPIRHETERSLDGAWTEAARQLGKETVNHVLDDNAATALLHAADTYDADAIVVGAHGRSGTPGRFLGSVTRKLLHHSSIPVIVVNSAERAADTVDRNGNEPVVACVGYGLTSRKAAEWAADYAEAIDRPLLLFHAVSYRPIFPFDSVTDMMWSYLGPDVPVDWAKADLESLIQHLRKRHPRLEISMEVEFGSAVGSIEDLSSNAEIVVLGKRHSTVISQAVIGPRIHHLVANGAFPTAIVPSCSKGR